MNYKNLFLLVLLISRTLFVHTQECPLPKNIQSPNAASLGKYGEIPISLFTGSPDITIPITTLNIHDIKLPVYLSYDPTGIKINTHPGWVGQNWTLSAGGVITRTVKGYADEVNNGANNYLFKGNEFAFKGYFLTSPILKQTDFMSDDTLKLLALGKYVNIDYESDIFVFNFMGITGKFFYGNDGKWKVDCNQNIEVIFNPFKIENYCQGLFKTYPGKTLPYEYVIKGFTLKDEKGNSYIFGYNDTEISINAIEYSTSFFGQSHFVPELGNGWIANAWYLTQVIDKFGNEIYSFEYSRGYYTAEFYRATGYRSFCTEIKGKPSINIGPSSLDGTECRGGNLAIIDDDIQGSLISPVYLKIIKSGGKRLISTEIEITNELEGKINYSYQDKKLDMLVAGNSVSKYFYLQTDSTYVFPDKDRIIDPIKGLRGYKLKSLLIPGDVKYKFIYNDTDNPNNTQRLNLLGIDIYENDWPGNPSTLTHTSYNFYYNQFELLPNEYISNKIDHWGYYNGKNYSIGVLDQYFMQRLPNENYTKIGVLEKITYPTGGYTRFEYESNSYSKYLHDDQTLTNEQGYAGGLRIKKLYNYDGRTETWKEFKYVNNYEWNHNSKESSGILSRKPKYYWPDWKVKSDEDNDVIFHESVFSVNSIVPILNSFGNQIGYSEIAEIRQDSSYTIYQFTNYDDITNDPPLNTLNIEASLYEPFGDKSLMRGKLRFVKFFDCNNNIRKQIQYIYRSDNPEDSGYLLGATVKFGYACDYNDYRYYKGNIYKTYFFDYDIKKEITTSFYYNGNLTDTVHFLREDVTINSGNDVSIPSANIRLLKKISRNDSKGLINYNYFYPTDDELEPYMQNLINSFRIGEPVKTNITRASLSVGTEKMTFKEEHGLILPNIKFVSKTDEASLEPDIFFDDYDENGNLLQYHNRQGIYNSLIWGYNRQYVIANIENSVFSNISTYVADLQKKSNLAYCSDCQEEKDLINYLKYTRKNLPGSFFTTYTYFPNVGLTSITNPNGQIQYFRYDKMLRLRSIQDDDKNYIRTFEYKLKD